MSQDDFNLEEAQPEKSTLSKMWDGLFGIGAFVSGAVLLAFALSIPFVPAFVLYVWGFELAVVIALSIIIGLFWFTPSE